MLQILKNIRNVYNWTFNRWFMKLKTDEFLQLRTKLGKLVHDNMLGCESCNTFLRVWE